MLESKRQPVMAISKLPFSKTAPPPCLAELLSMTESSRNTDVNPAAAYKAPPAFDEAFVALFATLSSMVQLRTVKWAVRLVWLVKLAYTAAP